MTNVSITIRLSPGDLDLIDEMVDHGFFTNRSDAIRDSIRSHMREMERKLPEKEELPLESSLSRYNRVEKEMSLSDKVFKDTFG